MEALESRALLSKTIIEHPNFVMGPLAGAGPGGGFTPQQLQTGYGFSSINFYGTKGTGKGETIAIVDAYDDPNIQSDLNTFDTKFGVAATTVMRVNDTGGTTYPASDPSGNWEVEESLDVEWAHAMAPGASIMLVEANSQSLTDLLNAVGYAASHAQVVSMSWGFNESSGETSFNSDFNHSGVAFVAASGDSGSPPIYPSASPNVLSVGGTVLTLTSGNAWSSESGWGDSGGGPSFYEAQPSYQIGVVTQTSTARATPDVAYDASLTTGVSLYDSVPYQGVVPGWAVAGGTSVGAPNWSALLAIADQGRALVGESALNSTGPQQVMDLLYQNTSDFHDITTGASTGNPHYSAGPGYDYVTGLGTPIANLVANSLLGTLAPHDTLVVTAPTTQTAGRSFNLTVTAKTPSGTTDTGYTGTITFTSTDSHAVLPASFTFPASDNGTANIKVTLKTAGSQSITANATSNVAITGTMSGISVSPAAASKFVVTGIPATVVVGKAQSFTVTARDPYGNVATGYTGTVMFTSSDTAALVPGNSAFTTSNQGVQSFSVTFETVGSQSLTATDTTSAITGTKSGISVTPAAPTGLTAKAVSSSQINLTWSASTGATGYEVERSLNTAGFTVVGTATTPSYSDMNLTAGTTYYYRVIATGGGKSSAASTIVHATTTGTAPATESIWGTSFSPTVNAYYQGAAGQTFELGVQFESNVAGEVNGVLFYKQSGTTGTNVGHLWSSSRTLLASATFTGETASGWQHVTFSSPVQIQANTFYTVSYNTGNPLAYMETGYFATSGVTNGNLTAPASTDINGQVLDNGVYNYGGGFPNSSQYNANFWVDVVFTPASPGGASPAVSPPAKPTVQPAAIVALSPSQSSHVVISPPAATPAGPASYAIASRGPALTFLGPLPSPSPIPQLGEIGSLFKKRSWWAE
jgi:subtilase family serine protease